jgi:phosphate transport system protein
MRETRQRFHGELVSLESSLAEMGMRASEAVRGAVDGLIRRDRARANAVIAGDDALDEAYLDIEKRILDLLALQTPVASDLRLVSAILHINLHLERVGDQAVNVAESVLVLLPHPPVKPLIDIPRMAEIAEKMVKDALDAFVRRDAQLARDVLRRDDEVDELKDQVFRELLTYMMADPGTIQRALALILISRNLERIADHATNIAEDVIFIAEAKDVRHHAEEAAGKP